MIRASLLIFFIGSICFAGSHQSNSAEKIAAIRNGLHQNHHNDDTVADQTLDWLINHPKHFRNATLGIGKRMSKAASNSTFIERADFIRTLNPKSKRFISVDFEALYAMENFFWGMSEGLTLELGALDGSTANPQAASQTGDFKDFGWDRIIIEANPGYREDTKKFSPDAFAVNAAICNPNSRHHGKVHYVYRGGAKSPSAGIVEFMTPNFLKNFYPFLLDGEALYRNFTEITFPDDTKIKEITCLPLQKVLEVAKVDHVNFFVLDVEGGELDVLHSINWHKTTFDVLCIETDKEHRSEGYAHHISHFLNQRGYKHVFDDRRNSWYTHSGLFERNEFKPSKRPNCCPGPNVANFPFEFSSSDIFDHEYTVAAM